MRTASSDQTETGSQDSGGSRSSNRYDPLADKEEDQEGTANSSVTTDVLPRGEIEEIERTSPAVIEPVLSSSSDAPRVEEGITEGQPDPIIPTTSYLTPGRSNEEPKEGEDFPRAESE